jgi:ribosomal protein L37AE/L43A
MISHRNVKSGETSMPITFQCPRCNRKLRAPESAARQSSQCPGCGGTVTCPEPVYEAEVVLVNPKKSVPPKSAVQKLSPQKSPPKQSPSIDPYAELDDDKPYAMVDRPPAAATENESRRPCPDCGEFILTSAAKCRFCGEVFDDVLKRGATKKGKNTKKAPSRSKASDDGAGMRDLVLGFASFVLGLGLTLFSFANPTGDAKGGGKFMVFTGLILGGIVGMLRGIWATARSGR